MSLGWEAAGHGSVGCWSRASEIHGSAHPCTSSHHQGATSNVTSTLSLTWVPALKYTHLCTTHMPSAVKTPPHVPIREDMCLQHPDMQSSSHVHTHTYMYILHTSAPDQHTHGLHMHEFTHSHVPYPCICLLSSKNLTAGALSLLRLGQGTCQDGCPALGGTLDP